MLLSYVKGGFNVVAEHHKACLQFALVSAAPLWPSALPHTGTATKANYIKHLQQFDA